MTNNSQGSRQNSVTPSASIESISDRTSIWRPVRLDHQPPTATESTQSLRSSAPTDHVRPVLGFEGHASHDSAHDSVHGSAHPPLLGPSVASREEKLPEEQKRGARWHPFWLRQAVFCSFCVSFLCCTIALPVMLSISKRNNGLFESQPNDVYLWRFGPTAILTIFSIFWSRVEFQALRYWPWMAMKTGQSLGPAGYSLDYTQMLSPTVLIRSLRQKHFFVFLVATASMVLKVQIILSPGLYQIRATESSDSVEVQLLDSFAVTEDLSNTYGTGPYYNARAIETFDMIYPFGVATQGAYQTFRLENQTAARGTINAPLTVTVDGVFFDMECQELGNYSVSRRAAAKFGNQNFTIDLQFENCEQPVSLNNTIQWVSPDEDTAQGYWTLDTQPHYPCSSLPRQNPTFIYYAGYYTPSAQNVSLPQLSSCAAVICSPTAYTSKVKIVDDGVIPKLTVLSTQNKTDIRSNLWVMLQNAIPSSLGQVGISATSLVTGPVATAFGFRGKDTHLADISLYQNKVLKQAVMNLTEQIGPMLSHYQLRQTETTQAFGSVVVKANKVQVNELICLFMTGLFAFTACIALWALFQSRKMPHIWHRNPATILGTLLFLQDNTRLSSDVKECLSVERGNKKSEWSYSNYCAPVLRSWFRASFAIFVLGLIVGLAVALNASQTSDGLGSVEEEGYLYLLWKSLPTLAMLLVSLHVTFNDTVMRDLATLSNLSRRPCDSLELDLSLLDMLGFRALYHSLRLKVHSVTVTQILAIFCAFLTTLTAALLATQIVPGSTSTQFQQGSWFSYRPIPKNGISWVLYSSRRQDIGSLLLTRRLSNFTYPRHTYADLLFPTLDIDDTDWNANISAQVRTPAAKLLPSCALLSNSDFEMSIGNDTENEFRIQITQPFTCPNGTALSDKENVIIDSTTSDKSGLIYVGELIQSPDNVLDNYASCSPDLDQDDILSTPWRVQTYMWGTFSGSKMEFEHLSIWRCNYSWVEVVANVNLIWVNEEILINHQDPPTQDNSTIRPWSPPISFPGVGDGAVSQGFSDPFPEIDATDPRIRDFSNRFSLLVEPFGPIQVEDFGNSSADDKILETLHFNLGFVSVQLANLEQRFDIDEESASARVGHGDLAPVSAIIIDSGRLRLIQNSTITFILIGILSLVLIVNVWALISTCLRHLLNSSGSWLLDLDSKGLAPNGFSSIAMMESLIHGTNFLKDVPDGACPTALGELHQWLAGTMFRIGWFQKGATNETEFTLGVLEDEDFAFLGDKGDIKMTRETTREIQR